MEVLRKVLTVVNKGTILKYFTGQISLNCKRCKLMDAGLLCISSLIPKKMNIILNGFVITYIHLP